jgi:hypothetical protein
VVDIEHQQRQRFAAAEGMQGRLIEYVGEVATVGKLGQRVDPALLREQVALAAQFLVEVEVLLDIRHGCAPAR